MFIFYTTFSLSICLLRLIAFVQASSKVFALSILGIQELSGSVEGLIL